LTAKLFSAAEKFGAREIFLSGGVAANLNLRQKIADFCAAKNLRFTFPEIKFCTDNAAMIGAAAFFIFKLTRDLSRGLKSNQNFEWEKVRLNLDFDLPKFHRR
jgi:tRNA A37 threonylcarbamoyltransferase TsaD